MRRRAEMKVTVVRGPFDVTQLNDQDLFWVLPNQDYVVFTNRLGRHRLYPVGALAAADLDWTRLQSLGPHTIGPWPERDDTLPGYAERIRAHAEQIRADALKNAAEVDALADRYDAMADDGWELTTHPDQPYPMLRDTLDEGRPDLRPGNFG